MTFGAFPFFVLVIAFPSGDIVTFFTGGGQRVCQQSGRNSYWCLWDIRIGVFEVIGELVVIRHGLLSWAVRISFILIFPDLALILSSPRSSLRAPEVGFEAVCLGFPGS